MRRLLYLIVLNTFLFSLTLPSFAQVKTISGVVIANENNQPLPDVSVNIKGTTIGVVTNQAGFFSIKAEKGQKLVFTFVGYAPHEITVGDATTLNVRLNQGQSQMGEVIVTAHGISRNRKSLGYSTPTVS